MEVGLSFTEVASGASAVVGDSESEAGVESVLEGCLKPVSLDCSWVVSLQDDVYDHIEKICDARGLCTKTFRIVN